MQNTSDLLQLRPGWRIRRWHSMDKLNSALTDVGGHLDILYVGTLPPHNGGTAIVGYLLLAGLASVGHSIRAIAPITPEALPIGHKFSMRHPRIRISRYTVPFFNNSPDQPMSQDYQNAEAAAIVRGFEAAISEKRPDLLIIGRETFAWHLPDLARSKNIASMLLIQGSGLFGMAHSFSLADRERLVEKIGKVDLIVAVAKHLEGPMRELGLPRAVTIPNPVDLSKFFPAPKDAGLMARLGLQADRFIIVHISNLKELKRTRDILASARDVVRREPRATYIVVGDGPRREQMEAECGTLGIIDRFRFVGWVDHEEVAHYIHLADTVVMPSESEAMALVYLETHACGRLLIASDIPAAREVLHDGENGLLFRMGDTADLSRKILLAANDPALRERIGAAARKRVEAHDLNHFVSAYDRVIRGIVRKHRPLS
jgi:glycosyltransferase involved in cell wall biosynthesis